MLFGYTTVKIVFFVTQEFVRCSEFKIQISFNITRLNYPVFNHYFVIIFEKIQKFKYYHFRYDKTIQFFFSFNLT